MNQPMPQPQHQWTPKREPIREETEMAAVRLDDDDEDEKEQEEVVLGAPGGTNRFFGPPGDGGDEKRSGRLMAAIEVPEPDEENAPHSSETEPVLLECVDADWYRQFERADVSWLDIYHVAPLAVLELHSYSLPTFSPDARPGDIVWFEFGYEHSSPEQANGLIYTGLFSQGQPIRVMYDEPRYSGKPIPGPLSWSTGTDGRVEGWPELHQVSDPNVHLALTSHLNELSEVASAGVAVYDVGQGSCQALVDEKHHIPLLYVDMGGGVLANLATFPADLRGLCFSNWPMVILSHWDWDHWSSAQRFRRALETAWLAPPVPEKPIQRAFAAELAVRGRLIIWDSAAPPKVETAVVRIERCTGRTVNDSGLAVTLLAGKLRRRNCLLPGDAAYKYVPSVVAQEKFSALCMTHHGGRLHSKSYPVAKRGAVAVNSSGPRNSYKHPLFSTLKFHLELGWPMPSQTGFAGARPSHVLMPWGGKPFLFTGGCHGGNACGVAPVQTAPHTKSIKILAKPVPVEPKSKAKSRSKSTVTA